MGGEVDQRTRTESASGPAGSEAGTPGRRTLSAEAPGRTTRDLAAPTGVPAPTDAAAAVATPPGPVRVIADGLNVRRTPTTSGGADNILGGLHHGDVVTAIAREGDWLRIEYRGEPAYVHGGYVEPVTPVRPAPAGGGIGIADVFGRPAGTSSTAAAASSASAAPAVGAAAAPTAAPAPVVAPPTAPAPAPASEEPHTEPPAPAARAAAPNVSAAPRTATAPAAGEFTTLSGNSIAKTTAKEAAVLNQIRAVPQRFDPAWLVAAQRNLGVVDATGAFNTETLRAMRTRSGNASMGASAILNTTFLSDLAPGHPFFEGTELGFEDHAPDATAHGAADRAAQAVGYASFAEYRSGWPVIKFLGKVLGPPNGGGSGRGHPYLAARIHTAEAFLRQRHPSESDAGVIRAIGWNGKGNAAYADELNTEYSHQHTMGLAIDIDPGQNPYIFNETGAGLPHDQAMWWITTFEEMFKIATRIYGGEPLKPDTLLTWSRTSSTEELFLRVQATSVAFAKFLELSKKSPTEILPILLRAGYSADEAAQTLPAVQKAEGLFHRGGGRDKAKSITNIREELLIALRDVAGLSWGGTEMSARENGDFMHFDCRDTDFGRAVYSKKAPGRTR